MTSHRHLRLPAMLAWLLAAALAGLALSSGSASAHPAAPPVPEKIQVEDGHQPYLLAHAAGVQIYECSPATLKWRLAPRSRTSTATTASYSAPTSAARRGRPETAAA